MWNFIQEQILGMKWLNALIGRGLSSLGLDTASRWGGSIQFFFYDVIKITILLCLLTGARHHDRCQDTEAGLISDGEKKKSRVLS